MFGESRPLARVRAASEPRMPRRGHRAAPQDVVAAYLEVLVVQEAAATLELSRPVGRWTRHPGRLPRWCWAPPAPASRRKLVSRVGSDFLVLA